MSKGERLTASMTDAECVGDQTVGPCEVRILSGACSGQSYEISDSCLIGASNECDIVLSDETVSKKHVHLTRLAHGFEVEDLGSRNGTRYLTSRIKKATVPVGAVFELGDVRVGLFLGAPDSSNYSVKATYGDLIGDSAAMRALYKSLEQMESSQFNVLISGETGSGRRTTAQAIHKHSAREKECFAPVDLEQILPAEMATAVFEDGPQATSPLSQTRKGTLFLGNLHLLDRASQSRLLQILEDKSTWGGRVIASATEELNKAVEQGDFLESLYLRLSTLEISVPALRFHREDIPVLVRCFLRDLGMDPHDITRETVELFTTGYDWPGNVLELKNAVVQAGTLGQHGPLSPPVRVQPPQKEGGQAFDVSVPFQEEKRRIIAAFERDYLSSQLEKAQSISAAARASKVERTQFKRLLRKHGLISSGSSDN